MPTSYPSALDTTTRFPADVTDDTDSKAGTPRTGLVGFLAQWVRDMGAATIATQTELGVNPKGSYANVATRLDSLLPKTTVVAASTANITISPGGTTLTVDGVTIANNDKILLKDQTAPAQNGIYGVTGIGSSVVLTRDAAADSSAELDSVNVGVAGGTTNGDTEWTQVTNPPITVGTTAIRFTRTNPAYPAYLRNPWFPGATPPLAANMDRYSANASVAQTAITAVTSLHGNMILRAGTTYTNINAFCTAAGSGTVTLFWLALVRQSDRSVLRATANTTVLPTAAAVHTRALSATLTVDVDTPVWVALSTQVSTTSPSFAGQAVLPAAVQPLSLVAPVFQGNSGTTPTATPPTAGTVLNPATTATSPLMLFWLT